MIMDFKKAKTAQDVDNILIEKREKQGKITNADRLRAELKKIELRLGKRKYNGDNADDERQNKRRMSDDPGKS